MPEEKEKKPRAPRKRKKCAKCHKRKDYSAFYAHPRTTDNLQVWCSECQKEGNRRRREAKKAALA
jgi:hypothetical protein